MNWFEGDISQAISLARQRNDVFVVFIYGNDEASTVTLNSINSEEVSKILGNKGFVAIKIESGCQSYHHFAQIYQLVPVPSIFFIGENGEPIDVIPGQANVATLLEHIAKVQAVRCPLPVQHQPIVSSNTDFVPLASTSSVAETASSPASTSSVTVTVPAPDVKQQNNSIDLNSSTSPEITPTQTLEERIQRAENARIALANKKQKEEEERERERELARRREGQEIAQARKAREAMEAQQALEERRRDREIEREARQKVLQQIAQDKLERAARIAAERGVSPVTDVSSATPTQVPAAVATANTARLQFRLPDGSSHTHTFESETQLGDVRRYVQTILHPGAFILSIAFPRSELASSDDNRSLRDLGLVPSAALLILPASSVHSAVASPNSVIALLWFILSPFTLIWSFMSSRIWGRPDNPASNERGPSAAAAAAQARANQGDVRQRVKREGNVHRLAGTEDPDDENNTYNGNSTQQM